MVLNLIGGYTGIFTSVDRADVNGSELYTVKRSSPPTLGIFSYTGGNVQLLDQRGITGQSSIGAGVPLAAVYHDNTYLYAAANSGTPPSSSNTLWAYQYTGGQLYTRGSVQANAPAGITGVATTISDVSSDGSYIYRVTYNESGYGSAVNLKAFTFNGTSFTEINSISVSSGSTSLVSAWLCCVGGYIHVAVKSSGVACLKAYTFNGSSFSLACSTSTSSSGLASDDTYIYTVQSNNLIAYNFNGSSYTPVGSSYALGAQASSIVCSNGKIYVAPTASAVGSILSFDGSSFTLEDTATVPTPLSGGLAYLGPVTGCIWATSYDSAGTRGGVWAFDMGSVTPPVAGFTGAPVTGIAPLSVFFYDQSTNTPTSWLWDFGDGLTGATQNPTHTYTGIGSYTVSLTATNTGGSDTETKVDYIITSAPPPSADFTASPLSGTNPLSVLFNDISTLYAPIVSRLWTFGDGHTSTSENVYHSYSSPGNYTVSLTVTTAYGSDTDTRMFYIEVLQAPVILKTTDTAPPESLPLLRVMNATGDGNQSTLMRGIRYYKTAGTSTDGSGFKRDNGPLLTFD